jgi:branched-chain amino acid transport system permease protein
VDSLDPYLIGALNGLAVGCLLFILAVGLSLVFGMMDVLNLAHGAIFLIGAYVAYALTDGGTSWAAFGGALALALCAGLLGGALLAGMTQPLARRGHLDQALLTLGVALVATELVLLITDEDVHSVAAPPGLDQSVGLLGEPYPIYRLVLIGVGAVLALIVYVVVERTQIGSLIRATVADREMVESLGVDSRKVLFGVFAAGGALAAVGGVLGAPIYGASPRIGETVLILALVVVVLGGLGSIKGALVGAVLIGEVESLGRTLLPDQSSFLLFVAMAVVLLLRPQGMFGAVRATPR